MIRPLQASDVPAVLTLLRWMDRDPGREVLAPEARSLDDLAWECSGRRCLVRVNEAGGVEAFCALSRSDDQDLVLEGPLGYGHLKSLLQRALSSTRESVQAFAARDNTRVKSALEHLRFSAMHTTDFYRLKRATPLPVLAPSVLTSPSPDLRILSSTDFRTYRALYRSSEDTWSARLSWTAADFGTHLKQDDVRLLVLTRGETALGFAELELGPQTQLTYLAVHPAERCQGYGTYLLQAAVAEAFRQPYVRELRVRAHDHEVAAHSLYLAQGFEACRSVVTYLRWRS